MILYLFRILVNSGLKRLNNLFLKNVDFILGLKFRKKYFK